MNKEKDNKEVNDNKRWLGSAHGFLMILACISMFLGVVFFSKLGGRWGLVAVFLCPLLHLVMMKDFWKNGTGCCGGHKDGNNSSKNSETMNYNQDRNDNNSKSDEQYQNLKQDPICGHFVPEKIAIIRVIKGRKYYFCSGECADKFMLEKNKDVV